MVIRVLMVVVALLLSSLDPAIAQQPRDSAFGFAVARPDGWTRQTVGDPISRFVFRPQGQGSGSPSIEVFLGDSLRNTGLDGLVSVVDVTVGATTAQRIEWKDDKTRSTIIVMDQMRGENLYPTIVFSAPLAGWQAAKPVFSDVISKLGYSAEATESDVNITMPAGWTRKDRQDAEQSVIVMQPETRTGIGLQSVIVTIAPEGISGELRQNFEAFTAGYAKKYLNGGLIRDVDESRIAGFTGLQADIEGTAFFGPAKARIFLGRKGRAMITVSALADIGGSSSLDQLPGFFGETVDPGVSGTAQVTTPPSVTQSGADDLERLRLQAEIERLRLEKLKLEQGQGAAGSGQATGEQGGKATVPLGRRVALVIGNSAYASLTPLTTPANDAQALAERLASLGYEVSLGINKTRLEMAELLAKFYASSEGAGVALFYFSGHGMQIEGRNYLLPVDAAFASQSSFLDVDARAIDLQKFIAASSTARIGVAFVDACRDNPVLEKSIVSSMFKSSGGSMTKGLAVVRRENLNAGQFVGFAAEPGKTAETGTGTISVYTQALLKSLEEKGLDVSIMHRRIRGEVEAATSGRQSPRYVDDLADAFALNPGS
jgi:hypothetical protein